jgi:hypothetical protein
VFNEKYQLVLRVSTIFSRMIFPGHLDRCRHYAEIKTARRRVAETGGSVIILLKIPSCFLSHLPTSKKMEAY